MELLLYLVLKLSASDSRADNDVMGVNTLLRETGQSETSSVYRMGMSRGWEE